jgi:hypothetical protein
MYLEELMAVMMLSSLLLLLCIFRSKRKFILKYENDLSNFFYGTNKVINPSWQNIIFIFIFIFILIYSIDLIFRKITQEKKSIFFPKLNENKKPFAFFPNAYEENLILFNKYHGKWVENQMKLNLVFMISSTIFFFLYVVAF